MTRLLARAFRVVRDRRRLFVPFALWLLAPHGAFAYLNDREARIPVNYFTLVPPAAGQSYLDPVFGTSIRRISDALNQPNSRNVGSVPFIATEYSTMSPFNVDDSRLLLVHHSYFAVYDGEGRYQKDLPMDATASSEPRWSRRDPNLLYYIPVYGNSLKSYDAASGVSSVVHTFAEYSRISGRGESDICFDGDHFVLVGDDRDVFVYELSTDTKGPLLDVGGRAFDQVMIAPDDNVLVGWLQTGTGRYNGVELYDHNMNFLRQLTPATGHMDVGRDIDGQPVLLWVNAADPQPPPGCQNSVVKVRLADAQQTCVLSLDWGLAVHISVPDGNGWFFVSTYAPGDPAPLPGQWRPYADEVLQVRLDGSEVRRLAHHRSRPFNDYSYMPRAAVSHDGRRLVFSSNYGLQSLLGYASYYSDAYLMDVAATSASYPGSPSALSERYEQDDGFVMSYSGPWYGNQAFVESGGSAVLGMDAGARGTFSFSGNGVRWIGLRDPWSGIARVSVDGQLRSTVDTYASSTQPQSVLFSASDLGAGSHTLDIEVTGTRNLLSGGSWVWLDAFDAVVRTEQDDPAASYSGTWYPNLDASNSGNTAALTFEPGARVSFRFSGRAVSWIGHPNNWSGIAAVYLDGTLRAEIDTYAAVDQAQAVIYTLSGLPPGEHTLTVEVTGRRHPLSLGTWVWVDAFETLPEASGTP